MNNGGDVLARGQKSAQFSTGGNAVDEPVELKNVAPEEEQDITKGVKVIDRRSTYNSEPVKKAEPKWPEKQYVAFAPILDRVLVKRVPEDKNFEMLEDGSMRDKRSGFVIPGKYRQHSCTGIVLATGPFVVIGGIKIPMHEVVKPGDKVIWGDYNSEIVKLPPERVQEMCDAVQMEYEADDDGVRIVRVQDIRSKEIPTEPSRF